MSTANGFIEALKDDQSVKILVKKMTEFDKRFCEMLAVGADFTLRLEVKGNKGSMTHARVCVDDIERPNPRV